ncbi:hypothetical protein DTL42_19195 [Bremerella cremea]|uniref:Uncharacterized protein n=1 Tax=Bremerella cremea TaxID=1031537 RepID=A0A368KMJ6_9BACT|nr:hypothetical protein DTL42_19195 [Bremerella cremea]
MVVLVDDATGASKTWGREPPSVLRTIAQLIVGDRPNRKEFRQIKRRPKPYKLLQAARKSIITREGIMS